MSTASPETIEEFDDILRPRTGIFIPERGTHVPGHYRAHKDNVQVMQFGIPLIPGFRVRDVAPERRWVVRENGDLMEQHEFQSMWHQHIIECLRLSEAYAGNPNARIDIMPEREPVPNVLKYVSVKVDPGDLKRLMLIHYDPFKQARRGPADFVDASGERLEEDRMSVLLRSYNDLKGRAAMRPGEIDEVENHLGINKVGGDSSIKAKLEMLLALKASGDISPEVFDAKVATLTGVEVAPVAPVVPADDSDEPSNTPGTPPKRRRGYCLAKCGEEISSFQSKKHAASCPKCKTIAEEA